MTNMHERFLIDNFELRGKYYQIYGDDYGNKLVDPITNLEIDPNEFNPKLTNEELRRIYERGSTK